MCTGKSVWKRITPHAVDGWLECLKFLFFLCFFCFFCIRSKPEAVWGNGQGRWEWYFCFTVAEKYGENGSLSKVWLMEGLDFKVYNSVSTHSNVCLSIWYVKLRICQSLINPEASTGRRPAESRAISISSSVGHLSSGTTCSYFTVVTL